MLMQGLFVKVEKNVTDINMSVDIMKKESQKLLQRASLAENEMLSGRSALKYALVLILYGFSNIHPHLVCTLRRQVDLSGILGVKFLVLPSQFIRLKSRQWVCASFSQLSYIFCFNQ